MLKSPSLVFLILALMLLGGCSAPRLPFYRLPSIGDLPIVHKIDIQQGNVITQDMVAQLRKGMDKKKVQFIMGTPIIMDTFDNTRWDYIYTYQHRGGSVEQRRVTLVFLDDKLDRVNGNVSAAAGEIEVQLHQDTTVDVPKTGGRGMMARLKDTIPFTGKGDKDDKKADANGGNKIADAGNAAAAKSGDAKADGASQLASADKPTGVEVPEDPNAEKALPAPVENPYENIQSAPGEGVVVPPDAPRFNHKRGLGTRFLSVFGLGEGDYVRPTAQDKPQEPLVKRPEPEDE